MQSHDGQRPPAEERVHSLLDGLGQAEPLKEEQRTVQDQGGAGGSMCANLTGYGVDYHNLEIGQLVKVKIFQEGILIIPSQQENPGEIHE